MPSICVILKFQKKEQRPENLSANKHLCQYQQTVFNTADNKQLLGIFTGLSNEVITNFYHVKSDHLLPTTKPATSSAATGKSV